MKTQLVDLSDTYSVCSYFPVKSWDYRSPGPREEKKKRESYFSGEEDFSVFQRKQTLQQLWVSSDPGDSGDL